MNHIKSLASQTAVYGISSIAGRLLNYLLVPLYTSGIFTPDDLGQVTYFYAFAAFLLIIFTHGMETTFFRFSTKQVGKNAYDYAFTSVFIVSLVVTLLFLFSADGIAVIAKYPGQGKIVRWMALIICIDAITSIPFARLRQENKARKFAVARISNIVINISFQLTFLLAIPYLLRTTGNTHIFGIDFQHPGIEYIFLSNLLANVFLILFLWKYFKDAKFRLSFSFLKPMLLYALPILITGIAGTINEQLDKIMVRDLLSDKDLGIYSQVFKLAVFIQLAVQAFRYAGEPFFFSKAKDRNAPELFADVLYYFVISGMILYIAIGFNIDLIGTIMLRSPEFRTALYLVPVIMIGKLLFGVYINISIWFKIKDKTIYGTYFTILGSVITIAGNLLLIPVLGYLGSAVTIVLVYSSMVATCYFVGKKYFPVPYKFFPMFIYIVSGVLLVWVSFQVKLENPIADSMINIAATGIFVLVVWMIEKKNFINKTY